MFARFALRMTLAITLVGGTFAAQSARALDLPPHGMVCYVPVCPLPGPLPKPEPWPPHPFPGPDPLPPHPTPFPIPEPAPGPFPPQPGPIIKPMILKPVFTPTAQAPACRTALAFDGTDGGCIRIPGEDKHPAPSTPPTPRH